MDVKVLVLKVQFNGPKYLKVKVEWFIGDKSLKIKQTIKIKQQDLKHWRPI